MGKAMAAGVLAVVLMAAVVMALSYAAAEARAWRRRQAVKRASWEEVTAAGAPLCKEGDVHVVVMVRLVAKWGGYCEILGSRVITTVPVGYVDGMALAEARQRAMTIATQLNSLRER